MQATEPCPTEVELWPVLVGEEPSAGLTEHLDSCDACRTRLVQRTREMTALRRSCAASATAPSTAPDPEPTTRLENSDARTFGEYRILDVLGEGGQAVVYRAMHPRLGCEVALKRTRPPEPSGSSAADLAHEAHWLARLRHPNLARVLDYDLVDGEPFLVLELIQGLTLLEARDRMTVADIISVMARLAAAVSAMHRHGLVHLDLKPENVLLTAEGEPRLIDLGLARRIDAAGRITTDVAGGTPEYMPPELWNRAEGIGVRSDVFGLGAILYALLTGHPPYRVDDAAGTVEANDGPRECAWSELDAQAIPPRLAELCRRSLAAEPGARPATPDEFSRQLQGPSRHVSARRFPMAFLLVVAISFGVWTFLSAGASASSAPFRLCVRRGRPSASQPLTHGLPIRTGDRLQFCGFAPADGAPALLVRCPSGRLLPLGPIESWTDDGRPPGQFRFPPGGGFLRLRNEPGVYVAVFALPRPSTADCHSRLIAALESLGEPPALDAGDVVEFTDASADLDPDHPIASPERRKAWLAWNVRFREAVRSHVERAKVIAFSVN